MYWFSADSHYNHYNIIKYCSRPFSSIDEMNEELIRRHNEVVAPDDVVVHAGDFGFFSDLAQAFEVIRKLNGKNILLRGSHDTWMNSGKSYFNDVWQKRINGQLVFVSHYAHRVWPASHYNSWHLYGHSHGKLAPEGKSWDIGVDNNNFYPVSFEQVEEIMSNRPDNFNFIGNQSH